MLGAKFHSGNRINLQKYLKSGEVIVLSAHAKVQKSADQSYFSQQRDFFYLTGIDEPDWILVITKTTEFLVAPKISRIEQIFNGSITFDEATEISGVTKIYEDNAGWHEISRHIRPAREVLTLLIPGGKFGRTYTNPALFSLSRRLRARTKAPLLSIHPQLHEMRSVKQPEEIKSLQKAIDITGQSFAEAKSQISDIKTEHALEGIITAGIRSRGAEGHAYDPIVAGGKRACTLHYIKNSRKLATDELVLIDIGAEVDYYSADITRVWSLSEPTPRQEEIHQSVNRIRQNMIHLLRPNLTFKEYFKKFDQNLGEELLRLRLINKPTQKNIRKYCPHGVSHFLGLDTHDVAPQDPVFKENMTITVEPGIYIPEENIGVRIEDNILITKQGAKNLSASIDNSL